VDFGAAVRAGGEGDAGYVLAPGLEPEFVVFDGLYELLRRYHMYEEYDEL